MGEVDAVWGQVHDGAWREFAAEVMAGVADRDVGIVEVEVLTDGALAGGCRPWVTVATDGGSYVAGVSGNELLAPEFRLGSEQESALLGMGFREGVLGADGESWFSREAGPDDLELLVGLTVRVLREVFGVVHPAFLDWRGQRPAPAGLDAPPGLGPRPRPGAAVASWPRSPDDLGAMVDDVVAGWLGHDPTKDDDGDIPIVEGESLLFVRISPTQPRVELFAVVVRDVRHRGAARREVNVLNRTSTGPTYWMGGDRVLMRRWVCAEPFVAAQLTSALAQTCGALDAVAHDLAERVGGVPFLADDSEGAW